MITETLGLSERQLREKEFYEQYVSSFDVNREVDFSPVKSGELRPWNSYWMVYHLAQMYYRQGAKLLDFGSGPGDNALRFSELGFVVEGFDICESNVDVSRELFRRYNRQEKGRFQVSAAECLPYPDDHFDFVAGIDILHHVDIKSAMIECKRVLKSDGVAVFREPVEVPILDWVRNTAFIRAFVPKSMSLELHITHDERKLNHKDMEIIKEVFPLASFRQYLFLARFDKFLRQGCDPAPSWFERIDHVLMKWFPFLRALGGARIIVMRKS